MGHAENRCVGVAVNGHDLGGFVHARAVLYRAAYAHGNVQGGTHGCARLTNLVLLADQPAVDCRTAGANGAANCTGQLVDQLEVFLGTDTSAAGHDNSGTLEVDRSRLDVSLDQLDGQISFVDLDRFLDHFSFERVVGIFKRHDAFANGGHLRPAVEVHDRGDDVSAEGRTNLQQKLLVQILRLRIGYVAYF